MNFKILHCAQIDAEKWNQTVINYSSDVYGAFEYLQVVCRGNWYGIIWGDYEKVLPFYRKKKWGLFPYITMPPFCQKFDTSFLLKNELEDVLYYFKKRNLLVEFRVTDSKGIGGFEEMTNYILDKKGKEVEEMRMNYTSIVNKNLQKSEDLLISDEADIVSIRQFLELNEKFQKLVIKKHKRVFQSLFDHKLKRLFAFNDKKIIAVLFYVEFFARVYLLFPYTNQIGRDKQAMTRLIDYVATLPNIKMIDFEGSSIDSIARFYSQFGATRHTYYTLRWLFFNNLRSWE